MLHSYFCNYNIPKHIHFHSIIHSQISNLILILMLILMLMLIPILIPIITLKFILYLFTMLTHMRIRVSISVSMSLGFCTHTYTHAYTHTYNPTYTLCTQFLLILKPKLVPIFISTRILIFKIILLLRLTLIISIHIVFMAYPQLKYGDQVLFDFRIAMGFHLVGNGFGCQVPEHRSTGATEHLSRARL